MRARTVQDLAAIVKGRRRDLGWTQAELAKAAGVSRPWVYGFEAGKGTAEIGSLLRVTDALALTLSLTVDGGSSEGAALDEILRAHQSDA